MSHGEGRRQEAGHYPILGPTGYSGLAASASPSYGPLQALGSSATLSLLVSKTTPFFFIPSDPQGKNMP